MSNACTSWSLQLPYRLKPPANDPKLQVSHLLQTVWHIKVTINRLSPQTPRPHPTDSSHRWTTWLLSWFTISLLTRPLASLYIRVYLLERFWFVCLFAFLSYLLACFLALLCFASLACLPLACSLTSLLPFFLTVLLLSP